MDLRNLSEDLSAADRCNERRTRIENELGVDLSSVTAREDSIGHADEKNCEQMFGQVPLPVGYAGPLSVTFSSGESVEVHLPLATTEGALVASVNRGCKALSEAGITLASVHHGISRSIALQSSDTASLVPFIKENEAEWKTAGESTSNHLRILSHDIDVKDDHVFLTINADTDEAMGMNMVTIAAQAIGNWIVKNSEGTEFITVAGNVDSDKKPSKRTHDKGRGYEVVAEATLNHQVITEVLKSSPQAMADVAHAKLDLGSEIAGSIGHNLHASNIVAAFYLATGQDATHVAEGSLADTTVEFVDDALKISVRCPAILVGVRGGGTSLPAQVQCLDLALKPKTKLHSCKQLAETVSAAVLAGEVSLLAAQASHHLASAHKEMGR